MDFNEGHLQAGRKEKIWDKIRGMLQDGVGETQDRKEYKREKLQEVARREKA